MININISADNSKEILEQIQKKIGGEIAEHWSECALEVDNKNAKGTIRFIPFDSGVNLMEYHIKFHKDVAINIEATTFNPIRFIYVLDGQFNHRFGTQQTPKNIDQFQSLIFTNKTGGNNYFHFLKGIQVDVNIIQIIRKRFLKKRTTNVSTLNAKLHEVFVDTDHDNRFVHFGTLNLKMADQVKKIRHVKAKDMLRVLKIEGIVYEILSLHIQQHDRLSKGVPLPTSLIKTELKAIRKLGEKIIKNPSKNYSLDQLTQESGLSQAKLQDGFKFLYNRTVTEYIRHIRLETAREMMNTSDLNISQIVYSIGFTSRSYFSKIFKEKYDITPNEFRKKVLNNLVVEESAA